MSRGITPIDRQKRRNRFVSCRDVAFQPDRDSRAKGVAFCRRWYSLYLTLHRHDPLFQQSREKTVDEVTFNYTPAKVD